MKIEYSKSIYANVVRDVLANAGDWGERIADGVDWSRLVYEVIDYPGVNLGNDFSSHVVPNDSGPGTYSSPSRSDSLVDQVISSHLSFVCADFAMPDGNPRIESSCAFQVEEVMFYVANRVAEDFRCSLKKNISAATSWTFLGVLYDRDRVGPDDLAAESVCSSFSGFVFGIYAGDSYMIVRA